MQIGTMVIPVCNRCAGIYIGIFGAQVYFIIVSRSDNSKYPKLTTNLIAGFLVIPLLLDWIGVRFGWFAADPLRRYSTGVIFGFVIGTYFILYSNRVRRLKVTEIKRLEISRLIMALVFTLLLAQILRWLGCADIFILILLTAFITFWVSVNYTFLLKFTTSFQNFKRFYILLSSMVLFLSEVSLFGYIWDKIR